jgi:hypothetical protein
MDASLAQDYDVEPPATLFVVNSGLQMGTAHLFSQKRLISNLYFTRERASRMLLFALSHSDIAPTADGPTYEGQYRRLLGLIDPASSFERAFLDYLY